MLRHVLFLLSVVGSTIATTTEILKWNSLLLGCFKNASIDPLSASRQLALLHVAQFEAANSVSSLYDPYLVDSGLSAGSSANPEASSAQAAHDILAFLYPNSVSLWDTELELSMASHTGDALDQSIALGAAAASAIIANRTDDGAANAGSGWSLPDPLEAGIWRPVSPSDTYLMPNWRSVSSWAVVDVEAIASQYVPPELFASVYEAEVSAVRQLGAAENSTRTEAQSLIARVWSAGSGTVTPAGQWFEIAQQIAISTDMSFMEQAQTFARLGLGVADAMIVCWSTKYSTQRWSPISAIQAQNDSTWNSYLVTPPFPAHTSSHSALSSVAATVLRIQTGQNTHEAFVVISGDAENRTLTDLAAAAEEAAWSRVYGGVHFESDSADGLAIGEEIGTYITEHLISLKTAPIVPDVPEVLGVTLDTTSGSNSSDSMSNSSSSGSAVVRTMGATAGLAIGIVGIILVAVIYYMLVGAYRRRVERRA
jgi:hypothetical protein